MLLFGCKVSYFFVKHQIFCYKNALVIFFLLNFAPKYRYYYNNVCA